MKEISACSEKIKDEQSKWSKRNFTLFCEDNWELQEIFARRFMRCDDGPEILKENGIESCEGLTEADFVSLKVMKWFLDEGNSVESLYVQLIDQSSGVGFKKECLKSLLKYPDRCDGDTPEKMLENNALNALYALKMEGATAVLNKISRESRMNKSMSATKKILNKSIKI